MSAEPAARIALIHALEESIAPSHRAFAEEWPEAWCFDLTDSSLSHDRAAHGRLDGAIAGRIRALAAYAEAGEGHGGRTAGILFTCSAFGPAIDAARDLAGVPVLKPNEAAFCEAVDAGSRIGLVVTFVPSLASLEAELRATALALGRQVEIRSVLAEGALAALKAGDGAAHDRLAAEAARSLGEVDAVVLGQFSLARAAGEVRRATALPVITTPHSAVRALRKLCGAPHSSLSRSNGEGRNLSRHSRESGNDEGNGGGRGKAEG